MKKKWICMAIAVCVCGLLSHSAQASEEAGMGPGVRGASGAFSHSAQASEETDGAGDMEELAERYRIYQESFEAIETVDDIEKNNYELIEDQSFSVALETFGEEEVLFCPILEKEYHRLAILIADGEGRVLYKTNRLETNYKHPGRLEQPVKGIAAVSFQDLDGNGLKDIVLITGCENAEGDYAGRSYRVGDVLFQKDGGFYRDWRISDKINRFSMNKSVDVIAAYVRDGSSTEALYTATTLQELLDSGFQVIMEQNYYRQFEKQGYLQIVPGVMKMAEYDVFMIFLVNEDGYIVWSFQPMGDYDSLYAMRGMTCKDMDGDGMKDIVVLAKYSQTADAGIRLIDNRCSIYYQRTDGFVEDKEFEKTYCCTENITMNELVDVIREYWGWPKEE